MLSGIFLPWSEMTAESALQVAGDSFVLELGHLHVLTLMRGQRVVPANTDGTRINWTLVMHNINRYQIGTGTQYRYVVSNSVAEWSRNFFLILTALFSLKKEIKTKNILPFF